jgi:sulfopyruvate decarboxylase subunit alpha
MTVSYDNSKAVFQGIKDAGVTSVSALPETWLGLLLQQAERDPDMRLIQVAKEEEAIGVAAGAYFAGERHILLMQNHGFLAAMNGVVSLAMPSSRALMNAAGSIRRLHPVRRRTQARRGMRP